MSQEITPGIWVGLESTVSRYSDRQSPGNIREVSWQEIPSTLQRMRQLFFGHGLVQIVGGSGPKRLDDHRFRGILRHDDHRTEFMSGLQLLEQGQARCIGKKQVGDYDVRCRHVDHGQRGSRVGRRNDRKPSPLQLFGNARLGVRTGIDDQEMIGQS